MHKSVLAATTESPHHVVVALDLRNAYNTISHRSCLSELRALRPELARLAEMFYCLSLCVAPKCDHLLRHLPPRVTARFGSQVDQLLLETFSNLVGLRLTPAQAEQVQMRVPDGGLGLRSRSGPLAAAAYLGSWALCAASVAEGTGISVAAVPALFADLAAAAEQVREAGCAAAAPLASAEGWRLWLAAQVETVQRLRSRPVQDASRRRWLVAALRLACTLLLGGGRVQPCCGARRSASCS